MVDPIYVPDKGSKTFRPHFIVKWNQASLEWEFWKEDELKLVISELALKYLVHDSDTAESPRIEFVVRKFDKHLVLQSVPLERAEQFIREYRHGQGEQGQG